MFRLIDYLYNENMKNKYWLLIIIFLLSLYGCQSTEGQSSDISNTNIPSPTSVSTSMPTDKTPPTDEVMTTPTQTSAIIRPTVETDPLPLRAGPRTQTSGTVPHVQIGAAFDQEVVDELIKLAFSLPGVEERPTIVSLPGTQGMWLADSVSIAHPEVIISGREFAHIHPDGSLHVPLPFERALEAHATNWAERHPWAEEREGWDGLVMLFTPQSMEEVEITFQLIIESYNYVTGSSLTITDLLP